jgi:hypothetical protein
MTGSSLVVVLQSPDELLHLISAMATLVISRFRSLMKASYSSIVSRGSVLLLCRKLSLNLDVFPLRLQWLLRFPFQGERYLERIENPRTAGLDPNEVLSKALPENKSLNVTGLIPRFKEGGAFVRFSHDDSISNEEAEQKVRSYLISTPIRPWWNPLVSIESHLVLGRPFVEV